MTKGKLKKLSEKHKYAAYLITMGFSNQEIADKMGIAKTTVEQWKQAPIFQVQIKIEYQNRRMDVMEEFVKKAKKVQKEHEKIIFNKDTPPGVKVRAIQLWEDKAGLIISPIQKHDIEKELKEAVKKQKQGRIIDYLEKNPNMKGFLKDIFTQISEKAEKEENNI